MQGLQMGYSHFNVLSPINGHLHGQVISYEGLIVPMKSGFFRKKTRCRDDTNHLCLHIFVLNCRTEDNKQRVRSGSVEEGDLRFWYMLLAMYHMTDYQGGVGFFVQSAISYLFVAQSGGGFEGRCRPQTAQRPGLADLWWFQGATTGQVVRVSGGSDHAHRFAVYILTRHRTKEEKQTHENYCV